jgi:GNAT superfamily N-acetyltransferase
MLQIAQAISATQCQEVRELLAEYIAWDSTCTRQLGLDVQTLLDFQYAAGAEEIPGVYTPPDGCLLLAASVDASAGCAAFRKLDQDSCELKRLYVRPAFQGQRLGRRLAEALIAAARQVGYSTMRLETTAFMRAALELYAALGFKPCAPYYDIPEVFREITVFLELDLRRYERNHRAP